MRSARDPQGRRNGEDFRSAPDPDVPGLDTPAPEILTVEQAASLLQISRASAYEAVRTQEIPSFRVGRSIRISRTQLLNWIVNQQTPGGDDKTMTVVVDSQRRTASSQVH